MQQQTVEQTVDVLIAQIMETIVEALELSSRSGFLRGFVSAKLFDKLMSCKMLSCGLHRRDNRSQWVSLFLSLSLSRRLGLRDSLLMLV